MSQSESSIRPRAALLQSAQGPRPYDRPPIGGEDRGAPSPLSGDCDFGLAQLISHVAASSLLLGGAGSDSGFSLEEKIEMGVASGAGGARGRIAASLISEVS